MNEKHFMKKEILAKMPADYVEPLEVSYNDFPASDLAPEGMKVLNLDLKNTYPQTILNVVYAHKNNKNLHLQIIIPPINEQNKMFPLIMFVQGSAFHKQPIGNHLAHMEEIAKRGYVVAIVEYRYAPQEAFPVQVRDLNTATRYMLDHAHQYHVDPNNYIAWGDSSGGHTVSLASATENNQFFSDEDISTHPLTFRACVDFYGPTDISRMNKVPSTQDHVTAHSLEGEFFGTLDIYENPELVQKGNPLTYISEESQIPPFIIMHGNKDRCVPFEQSCILYEALKKNNKIVDFYKIENSDHASDAFFSKEVLDIVLKFVNGHLRK
ncbi:acetyl esterase/lipase [Lactobacillus colini]|uniref:Acetyl esterase/lipase n=1 Tax=Lactobacillus colini TaxID=1819254 RepID=A0ABS4MF41_9LACO|nr:alpha/beta hydrolase [Lactobacillus colini]MBP2058305.1 acetyl esterase/lipase [Lactobacillus colini]